MQHAYSQPQPACSMQLVKRSRCRHEYMHVQIAMQHSCYTVAAMFNARMSMLQVSSAWKKHLLLSCSCLLMRLHLCTLHALHASGKYECCLCHPRSARTACLWEVRVLLMSSSLCTHCMPLGSTSAAYVILALHALHASGKYECCLCHPRRAGRPLPDDHHVHDSCHHCGRLWCAAPPPRASPHHRCLTELSLALRRQVRLLEGVARSQRADAGHLLPGGRLRTAAHRPPAPARAQALVGLARPGVAGQGVAHPLGRSLCCHVRSASPLQTRTA